MITMPRMLLIGAATKDAGKTTLSCRIVRHFCDRGIVAVKATIHRSEEAPAHYSVIREEEAHPEKDTGRLFAAGAAAVYWLRSDEHSIEKALAELTTAVPEGTPLICESNTLRRFVKPGAFLFVRRRGSTDIKPTARIVLPLADLVAESFSGEDDLRYDPDILPRLSFVNGKWSIAP